MILFNVGVSYRSRIVGTWKKVKLPVVVYRCNPHLRWPDVSSIINQYSIFVLGRMKGCTDQKIWKSDSMTLTANQTSVATTYKIRWWFMNFIFKKTGWFYNLNSKYFGQTPSNPYSLILIFPSTNTDFLKHKCFEICSTIKCLMEFTFSPPRSY